MEGLEVRELLSTAAPWAASTTPPLDTKAFFRTHVAHSNDNLAGGGGGTSADAVAASSATFGGAPYSVGSTITPTTSGPEAEEHIAVDPTNPNNLVAAISDFALRGGSNTTKYVVSTDNGAMWRESYVPLVNGSPATGDGQIWPYNSDPVVAIDKLGNVYLADLYFHSETGNNSNGLYVSVANLSSGVNFTQAQTFGVATDLDPATNVSEDKEWIAVDNSNTATSGTVYVSWTRFVGNSDMILVSRSTDHGVTWSRPLQISPPAQNGAVQGSQVAVGPGGEVYVVYEVSYIGGRRQQYLAKSTNGGMSFTAPVAVTPTFNELNFNSTYRKNSFAALAVSPTTGSVYLAYADQPSRKTGAEVEFIRSTTPGGTTFTAPVVLNDQSTGQQFMPALAVDSAGTIHASWFDTRLGRSSSFYDIFATRSLDGGLTFSPNARVTTTTIDAGSASFIGDYAGIAADGGYAHPVWTSGGFNNGKLKTATLH